MVTPVFAVAGLSSVLGQSAQEPRNAWAPVVLLLLIGIGFAVGNLVISLIIGPSRTGPGKEATYESGMLPVGDTHKRFNVRFYIVAMIFLVFDVEIVHILTFAGAPYARRELLANFRRMGTSSVWPMTWTCRLVC